MRDDGEDLFIIEQLSQDFIEVKKAEYVGYRNRVQRESELLFKPSFRTGMFTENQSPTWKLFHVFIYCVHIRFIVIVPTSVKLPENMRPRYLEDEGLYVGERPPVSLANENVLENRILKTKEVKPHCAEPPQRHCFYPLNMSLWNTLFKGKEVVWRWRQDHSSAQPPKGIVHKTSALPHGGETRPCATACVQKGQTLTSTTLYLLSTLCIHTGK